MDLINGFFTPIDTLPPLTVGHPGSPQSIPVLGLYKKGVQGVVRAYKLSDESDEVCWEEVSAVTNGGRAVTGLVGWMYLPGSERSSAQSKTMPVPITEVDVYSATLEACVQAEASDQVALAQSLRAWVDASPFHGCPTGCNGRPPFRNEPPCSVCKGTGFVPES